MHQQATRVSTRTCRQALPPPPPHPPRSTPAGSPSLARSLVPRPLLPLVMPPHMSPNSLRREVYSGRHSCCSRPPACCCCSSPCCCSRPPACCCCCCCWAGDGWSGPPPPGGDLADDNVVVARGVGGGGHLQLHPPQSVAQQRQAVPLTRRRRKPPRAQLRLPRGGGWGAGVCGGVRVEAEGGGERGRRRGKAHTRAGHGPPSSGCVTSPPSRLAGQRHRKRMPRRKERKKERKKGRERAPACPRPARCACPAAQTAGHGAPPGSEDSAAAGVWVCGWV